MRKAPTRVLAGADDNCALIAFYNLSNKLSEERIYEVALNYDFREGHGILASDIPKMAEDLGFKITEIESINEAWETGPRGFTVNYARKNLKGTYIALVPNHMFVIHNGVIIDPNDSNYGITRTLVSLWQVHNSDLPLDNLEIDQDTLIEFRTHYLNCTRENSNYRLKLRRAFEEVPDIFRPKDIRHLFTFKEVESLVMRGIFAKSYEKPVYNL